MKRLQIRTSTNHNVCTDSFSETSVAGQFRLVSCDSACTDLAFFFWAALICAAGADGRPVLPQQEDPQGAQGFDAAHFSDVIVRQVEENKLLQMWEVLDPPD